jgi:hypothetical protein
VWETVTRGAEIDGRVTLMAETTAKDIKDEETV